jgi:hypothetical protein
VRSSRRFAQRPPASEEDPANDLAPPGSTTGERRAPERQVHVRVSPYILCHSVATGPLTCMNRRDRYRDTRVTASLRWPRYPRCYSRSPECAPKFRAIRPGRWGLAWSVHPRSRHLHRPPEAAQPEANRSPGAYRGARDGFEVRLAHMAVGSWPGAWRHFDGSWLWSRRRPAAGHRIAMCTRAHWTSPMFMSTPLIQVPWWRWRLGKRAAVHCVEAKCRCAKPSLTTAAPPDGSAVCCA